jgi:hypothetical protein
MDKAKILKILNTAKKTYEEDLSETLNHINNLQKELELQIQKQEQLKGAIYSIINLIEQFNNENNE